VQLQDGSPERGDIERVGGVGDRDGEGGVFWGFRNP
jgi:hypothetical protein